MTLLKKQYWHLIYTTQINGKDKYTRHFRNKPGNYLLVFMEKRFFSEFADLLPKTSIMIIKKNLPTVICLVGIA